MKTKHKILIALLAVIFFCHGAIVDSILPEPVTVTDRGE